MKRGWKEFIPDLVVFCGLRTTETSGVVRGNKIALRQVQHVMRMTIPYDAKIALLSLIFNEDSDGSFVFSNNAVVEAVSEWFLHGNGGDSLINISDDDYIVLSIPNYKTDDHYGLCNDGDTRCVRLVRDDGRIVKVKLGKVLSKFLSEQNAKARGVYCENLNPKFVNVKEIFCSEALTYVTEQICSRFAAYVDRNSGFELVVNDDFQSIYDSESWVDHDVDGDSAHSCMRNHDEVEPFYRAAGCKAAGLWKNGSLYARCVIYQNVYERIFVYGKPQDIYIGGVAERQYAINQDTRFMQMLVDKLYEAGVIKYHKRVGTSCWNHDDFVDSEGKYHHKLFVKTSWTPEDDYPFVDGFCYARADKESCELATWRYGRYSQLELDNTSTNMGSSAVFSKYADLWLNESDTEWSDSLDDYLPRQDCYWDDDEASYVPLEGC